MDDVIEQVIGNSAACLMAQAVISTAFLPRWTNCLLCCLLCNCAALTEGLDFRECSSLAINSPGAS